MQEPHSPRQPNILLIVSDEERRNGWLDGMVDMPAHDRLRADGLSFSRYYTHASPCSPSRASLYTGRYLADHGVVNNVAFPSHTALDPDIPTIGSLLRDVGYQSGYVGKWHLSHSSTPTMTDYGYEGWEGNDKHYTGAAWTGRHFDPVIADQAVRWMRSHASDDAPWFLTVALVNPHDIMWYPIDQPDHLAANPKDQASFDFIRNFVLGDEAANTPPPGDFPERFDELPANFHDDLSTKPAIQKAWQDVRNTDHHVGSMDLADTRSWLRQLDYYAWLHEHLDANLATVLGTLDELGIYDDTTIIYTSDHGDACGSHGLRAKLPCVYEEVMGVPLIVKAPEVVSGATTDALATHVDLAATVAALGGADVSTLQGHDLAPVFGDPAGSVRDYVLFSQDSAQSDRLREVRYAVRGFFDGTTKYARYYGVGGGIERDGSVASSEKTVRVDAAFEDQEHEWYNLNDDPHELHNRANDTPDRSKELREQHERLLTYEAADFG